MQTGWCDAGRAGERIKIQAQPRERVGSRDARRLRNEGLVPAVLYGHGIEPIDVAVGSRELRAALTSDSGLNALISLEVEGTKHLAMARQLQRHPVRRDQPRRGGLDHLGTCGHLRHHLSAHHALAARRQRDHEHRDQRAARERAADGEAAGRARDMWDATRVSNKELVPTWAAKGRADVLVPRLSPLRLAAEALVVIAALWGAYRHDVLSRRSVA